MSVFEAIQKLKQKVLMLNYQIDLIYDTGLFDLEKICLDLESFKIFTLPGGVLNSACLRYLEVCMNPKWLLNLPSTSFGGLENLRLRDVRVSIEFGELISSCKSLKMLYLCEVDGLDELNITSSSLEDLKLEDMLPSDSFDNLNIKVSAERPKYLHIEWPHSGVTGHSLTLHNAPKLVQFFWNGIVSNYSCEGNLESLYHCDVDIIHKHEEIIGKVLQAIHCVSSMHIDDYSIQEISPQELLPEFFNLHSSTLKCSCCGNGIPSIASLLNPMPHLNTLKIEEFPDSTNMEEEEICYNAEYWESQNLKFVDSLKELEMEIGGEQNEMELIKYLLKNAKALKTLTIDYSYELCHRQSEITRKIQQFQIASSSITMYFLYNVV